MMRHTIGLLVIFALTLLVVPLAGEAQPARKMPRVGVLSFFDPPVAPDEQQQLPFLHALRDLGWVEEQTIAIEWHYAQGERERLPDLAAELVRLPVDLIVTNDTPAADAARRAASTIPIVSVLLVVDPIADDFVATLSRPGRNITGGSGQIAELSGKLLERLIEAVPGITHAAILTGPRSPARRRMVTETIYAAQALGVQPHVIEVHGPAAFAHAFEVATTEGAGALLLLPEVFFSGYQRQLAALAVKSRLPAMYWTRTFAAVGGLMAHGPRVPDLWRRAAALVDKILKGDKPADLPMEQPMKFELVINLKTAQELGLTIPPTLLFQADEVIR
jgi:putative tryptophan/tyrosine transport system substrate-binding protein